MANKYSRYQLQDAPSQYVDPKKIEISSMLSERYDKNKQSKDLIDRALAQMDLMEGDKGHLERVKGDVKGMLNSHIEKKDWENSTLVIQDAANVVETDKGLLAAKKSMANRQEELEVIRKARLEGIEMLDFGADRAATHQSYFFDEESETFQSNVYEHASEKKLDYETKMTSLLKTIKADGTDGWEGITTNKADRVAAMMYANYINSTEGRQDFKRLTQLELPQNLSPEEKADLAKKDIMHRLKGVTRQYVYNKYTVPKGGGNSSNGPIAGWTESTSSSSEGNKPKNTMARGKDMINLLSNSEDKDNAVLQEEIRNATQQADEVENSAMKHLSKGDQAAYKEAVARKEALKASYVEAFGEEEGTKLYTVANSLSSYTNHWDTDVVGAIGTTAKHSAIGAGGLMGVAAPGALALAASGAGAPAGAALIGVAATGGAVLGAASGAGSAIDDEMAKFRNVIDWHRSSRMQEEGFGANFLNNFIDTEEEQLWEEIIGGDEGDGDFSKFNKAFGTNFTKDDRDKVKELLSAQMSYKYGEDGKISGHDIDKYTNENGHINTNQSYSTDATAEGKKARLNHNSAIKSLDPEANFIIVGGNTKDDWDDWTKSATGKDLWSQADVFAVTPGSAKTNTPPTITIDINGDTREVQSKIGMQGIFGSIFQTAGLNSAIQEENYNASINRYEQQTNSRWTKGNDIRSRSESEVAQIGGDQKDLSALIKKKEDFLIQTYLRSEDSVYSHLFAETDKGDTLIKSTSTLWFDKDRNIYPEAWREFEEMYPNIISGLRFEMTSLPYR